MKTLTQKICDRIKSDNVCYDLSSERNKKLTKQYDSKNELINYLLLGITNNILIGKMNNIDLLETLENFYKGEYLRIWIPIIPPGINATYGVNCGGGKRKVYKTKEAKEWEKAASTLIISASNYNNFLINKNDKLSISILIKGSKHDVDAPIKMILDTVARTLDFDDKIVLDVHSKIKRNADDRGILIEIEKV